MAPSVAPLLGSLSFSGQGIILLQLTTRRRNTVEIARYQAHDHADNIVSALVNSGVVVVESLLEETVVAGLNTDLRAEFDREGHLYQNSFNGHRYLTSSTSIPCHKK